MSEDREETMVQPEILQNQALTVLTKLETDRAVPVLSVLPKSVNRGDQNLQKIFDCCKTKGTIPCHKCDGIMKFYPRSVYYNGIRRVYPVFRCTRKKCQTFRSPRSIYFNLIGRKRSDGAFIEKQLNAILNHTVGENDECLSSTGEMGNVDSIKPGQASANAAYGWSVISSLQTTFDIASQMTEFSDSFVAKVRTQCDKLCSLIRAKHSHNRHSKNVDKTCAVKKVLLDENDSVSSSDLSNHSSVISLSCVSSIQSSEKDLFSNESISPFGSPTLTTADDDEMMNNIGQNCDICVGTRPHSNELKKTFKMLAAMKLWQQKSPLSPFMNASKYSSNFKFGIRKVRRFIHQTASEGNVGSNVQSPVSAYGNSFFFPEISVPDTSVRFPEQFGTPSSSSSI